MIREFLSYFIYLVSVKKITCDKCSKKVLEWRVHYEYIWSEEEQRKVETIQYCWKCEYGHKLTIFKLLKDWVDYMREMEDWKCDGCEKTLPYYKGTSEYNPYSEPGGKEEFYCFKCEPRKKRK